MAMIGFRISKAKQLQTLQDLVDKHFRLFEVQVQRGVDGLGVIVKSQDGSTLQIGNINTGPLFAWNSDASISTLQIIHPGDSIVAVNGIKGPADRLLETVKNNELLSLQLMHGSKALHLGTFDLTESKLLNPSSNSLMMSWDCLNYYQQNRKGGLRSRGSFTTDPRTRLIEFLKAWLKKFVLDVSVTPPRVEVTKMADLCGDILLFPKLFPQSNTCSFLRAMAQVQTYLRSYLAELRVEKGDWNKWGAPSPGSEHLQESGLDLHPSDETTTASEGDSEKDLAHREIPYIPDEYVPYQHAPVQHAESELVDKHARPAQASAAAVRAAMFNTSFHRGTKQNTTANDCFQDSDDESSDASFHDDVATDFVQVSGSSDEEIIFSRSSSCVSLDEEIVVAPEMLLDTE